MKKISVILAIVAVLAAFACSCKGGENKSDLSLSKTEIIMKIGESEKLVLKKDGIIVTDGVTWTSSDENSVVVNDGIITARAKGKSTVTAEYEKNKVTCKVTVNAVAQTGLFAEELYLCAGDEQTLDFTVNGEKVTDGVLWSSSDKTIATVENGKVTGVEKGAATITATYDGREYTCVAEVNPSPVGEYVAVVTVNEMDGATFTFDLTLKADKTYEYSRRDSGVKGEDGFIAGEKVNSGAWAFEKGGVIKFTYAGGEMRMKVTASSALQSVGEIVTGGMQSQMSFEKR